MACPGRYADPRLSLLLALALSLPLVSSRADEPILARVIAITADGVTLAVADGPQETARELLVPIDAEELEPGVEVGRLVRLWPGATPPGGGPLTGARLTPLESDLRARDRTGVRARLMYGAQRGFGGGLRGGGGGR